MFLQGLAGNEGDWFEFFPYFFFFLWIFSDVKFLTRQWNCNRCLEEGAEEFFLKPVRMSDLNRLRPHLMKTKLKDQNHEKQDNLEIPENVQEQKQPQNEQQQSLAQANNNKRKAMDQQGVSPDTNDRTRPRYNDIATVVW